MLRAPYDGSLALSDENKLNSVANYSCDYGFQIIGNILRVCQSSGIWTGRPPGCYGEWMGVSQFNAHFDDDNLFLVLCTSTRN